MSHDINERVASLETETRFLQDLRTDLTRRLQRVEWMVAVSIGTGLLGIVKGCL